VRAAVVCTNFSQFCRAWDALEVLVEALLLYTHKKEIPADRKKQEICKLKGNVFLIIEWPSLFFEFNSQTILHYFYKSETDFIQT